MTRNHIKMAIAAAGGQKRVAEATGVDQSSLSRICRGERNYSTMTMERLLSFFTEDLGYTFSSSDGYDMVSVPRGNRDG